MVHEYPLIFMSTRRGDIETILSLLQQGVLVDTRGGAFDRTSLFEAVVRKNVTATRLLLQYGASVKLVDSAGWTALHAAAIHDSRECCKILLEHGSNVFTERPGGATPLDWGALNDNTEVLRMMFTSMVDMSATRTQHKTWVVTRMLVDSIQAGHVGTATLLVEEGADIDYIREDGCTMMDIALRRKNTAIIYMLKEARLHRDKCEAFALGNIARVGDGSLISPQDVEVVDMILKLYAKSNVGVIE
jgi:hypothetical protein